ncbi:hypothetical protein [Paraburkholderia phosphatilytica]|uniref:hypothetical protein n=1 Tax=Paraburkholderia phosphatilytica TaxID=2282883 RepID=UPI001F0BB63E|nr:hypothetical protein [Paraburkholderia phosphatilytica]
MSNGQRYPQRTCATCNGNGMIGGPSYYAPDEGGVPCPDCTPAPSPVSGADERAAFEAKFAMPSGVEWDGTKYAVRDGWENSYRCACFVSQWDAWQARAVPTKRITTVTVYQDVCQTEIAFSDGTSQFVGAATFKNALAPTPTRQHSDDAAVDRFCAAMKAKLAQARDKGRGGWEQCDPTELSIMLREHVEKGDPRDVANFCMFLWALGHPISDATLPMGRRATQTGQQALSDEQVQRFMYRMIEAGFLPQRPDYDTDMANARAILATAAPATADARD